MFSFFKDNFLKIKSALQSTSLQFSQGLKNLFANPWTDETLEQLESLLYKTDMGSQLVELFVKNIKSKTHPKNLDELEKELIQFGHSILKDTQALEIKTSFRPTVILVVGTNGSGKTTFCAKLAHKFLQEGKSVILGAADTFRAAAINQLQYHADRLNVQLVKHAPGADPAAVCFDTIQSALAKNIDVVILDTSGRLENKLSLMNELKKIHTSCAKACPGAPHYTLLNLDASLGQSALIQAKAFNEAAKLSALVLSKFDGSPKGGVLLSLAHHMKLPVAFLGTGEKYEDLAAFETTSYLEALFASKT